MMDGVIRKGVSTHGALFSLYDVYGDPFEITAKYRPPIEPLGRGAYGIVWYCFLIRSFFFFPISFSMFLQIALRFSLECECLTLDLSCHVRI